MNMPGTPSIYGWDVVFATSTSVVNAGLSAPGDQPFDETVKEGGVTVHARGETGGWQVTDGGSGALVNFKVPCSTLTLSDGHKTVNFADGEFQVQCRLHLQTPAGSGDDDRRELVVSAAKGAVTVTGASFSQNGFGGFAVYAKAALQAWVDAQTSFPYVLADVRLAGSGDDTLDRALAPATASFAYSDVPGGGGVLGILCTVVGGTAPDALLQEVSPDALGDADAVVLVSQAVLQRLVDGAAAAVTLPGTSASTAQIAALASFPLLTKGAI